MSRDAGQEAGDAGFTLVEMLVAIVLIGLVMAAMATGSLSAFGSVRSSNGQAAANQLANETIEQLRAAPFNTVAPPGTSLSHAPALAPRTVKGLTLTPTATVAWVNETCNDTAAAASLYDYLRLTVVVTWQVSSATKSLTVESFRMPGTLYRSPISTVTEPQQTTVRVESCS